MNQEMQTVQTFHLCQKHLDEYAIRSQLMQYAADELVCDGL